MINLAVYFAKKFIVQVFLLIPVVFNFAIVLIFLETQFSFNILTFFGLDEFLNNSFNLPETMNEGQILALLLTIWMIITVVTSIFERVFKFNLSLNPKIFSRTVHGLNFFLLSWLLVSDDGQIIISVLIAGILNLVSYASSVIYIHLSKFMSLFKEESFPGIKN